MIEVRVEDDESQLRKILVEISPEVSLFECLHALGEVALGQASAEFSGDISRAERCVIAMIDSGWVTVVVRTELGENIAPKYELKTILSDANTWKHFNEETAPILLRITDKGVEAFESETNFYEKLDKEFERTFQTQTWQKKSKKRQ